MPFLSKWKRIRDYGQRLKAIEDIVSNLSTM